MSSIDSLEWKRIADVIELLSDGSCHSGEELGDKLLMSRAGIWKYIKKIEQLGIEIESIKGKGYQLKSSLSLLQYKKINHCLDASIKTEISALEIFPVIDSTNTYLLTQQEVKGKVCLAELQTSGRGRRGRVWVSPFAKNIYLSIGWRFDSGISAVQGLSLAVGVVIVDLLKKYHINNAYLKWPNDVLVGDPSQGESKKLAGVLIELRGDLSGDCELILGVGLNYDMQAEESIDQPWVSLRQMMGDNLPDRNQLAAELINYIMQLLLDYERNKFSYYRDAWEDNNFHRNQIICASSGVNAIEGQCLGVNPDGALILLCESGEQQLITGGEISIRRST